MCLCAPVKLFQALFRRRVEIVLREAWIEVALAFEIAPDIAAIFAQERIRVVFGMPLQEQKAAAEDFKRDRFFVDGR